jgi:hypothetical protein
MQSVADSMRELMAGFQNFVHVQLSQIMFMKNSQPRHFVSKNKSPRKLNDLSLENLELKS